MYKIFINYIVVQILMKKFHIYIYINMSYDVKNIFLSQKLLNSFIL